MFGEKQTERVKGKDLPVWQTPKYEQSKKKAMEIIDKYDNITEGDFWILMNTYANGTKMMYSGLIISHNGCLKINEAQPPERKFKPSSVIECDKEAYGNSLVFTYSNDEQGIFEVGEASAANCKNPYPYAMAFKRLYDRVVLKLCGLAFDGIYSDSEADEFKEPEPYAQEEQKANANMQKKVTKLEATTLSGLAKSYGSSDEEVLAYCGIEKYRDMTKAQYGDVFRMLEQKYGKKE